jgi:hypothetical protein
MDFKLINLTNECINSSAQVHEIQTPNSVHVFQKSNAVIVDYINFPSILNNDLCAYVSHHDMKTYRENGGIPHALGEGDWLVSCSGRFTPGEGSQLPTV